MRPTPDDLLVLAQATRRPRQLARLVARAIVEGHDVDVQIERHGRDFVLVTTETVGDLVVAEHRQPIHWEGLAETVRLHILGMYLAGVLEGHARWRRRMAPRLAALGGASIPSPTAAAND